MEEIASCFYESLPKVPEGANTELEKPYTKGELYDALKSMESGKAPGSMVSLSSFISHSGLC